MGIKEMIKNKLKEKKDEDAYRKKLIDEIKEETREELKAEIKKEMAEQYKNDMKSKIIKKPFKEKLSKFGEMMGAKEIGNMVTDDKINRMIGSQSTEKKKKTDTEGDSATDRALKRMMS